MKALGHNVGEGRPQPTTFAILDNKIEKWTDNI